MNVRRDRRPLPVRSLKARALQWLAQREQSRAELRRKLLAAARADAVAMAAAAAAAKSVAAGERAGAGHAGGVDAAAASHFGADTEADADPGSDEYAATATGTSTKGEVDAVLAWLEAHGYLSDARFVESRVHAREARFGNLRIQQELKQHATALPADLAAKLVATELDRARSLLARRFGTGPTLDAEAHIEADPNADGGADSQAAAGRLTATERAKRARFLLGRGFSGEVVRRALRMVAGPAPYDLGDSRDDD